MSDEGMPQYICLDISKMTQRPKHFRSIAFDCWHDYKTNPATIQLLVSSDPIKNYITWSTFYLELVSKYPSTPSTLWQSFIYLNPFDLKIDLKRKKEGVQTFSIDLLGARYGYIKVFKY